MDLRQCLGVCEPVELRLQAIGVPEEHLDRALGRHFCLMEAEMYPQKYTSVPSSECAIENGDF